MFFVVVVVAVAVVAVDLNDAIIVVAALHLVFTVCTDTVFLFIAAHVFCDNTSSNLDNWLNKESITLSLVLIYFL